MNRYIVLLIFLFSCARQQTVSPPFELGVDQKGQTGTPIPRLTNGEVGFILYSLNDRKVVDHFNEEKLFMTASTAKILTAYSALSILGANYRFKTKLLYTGKLTKKGILKGDLYLVGDGDPLLMSDDLISLAQQILDKNIREVQGHFYYDEGSSITSSLIDPFQSDTSSYNPGISALSSNFNQLDLFWNIPSSKDSSEVNYWTYPPKLPIAIEQQREKNQNFLTYKDNRWIIGGPIQKSGHKRIPDRNPAQTTAYHFSYLATHLGLQLPRPEIKKAPRTASLLGEIEGIPLIEVISKNLEFSNNLLSELILLKAMTTWKRRIPKNLSEAAGWLQQWYRERKIVFSENEWKSVNGSGLNKDNQITPQIMLKLLLHMEKGRFAGRPFWALFPISGYKGTLHKRFQSEQSLFRVWAKTGTMSYALGLTGHIFSHSGKHYLFSIYAINRDGRKKLEESFLHHDFDLQQKTDLHSDIWNKEGQRVIDSIVNYWATAL